MTTFKPNRAAIRALASSEGVARDAKRRAEKAAAFAQTIAPRDTNRYADGAPIPPGESGGGFHVEEITGPHGERGARLRNTTPYAYFLEHGYTAQNGRRMPAHRTVQRSIDAMRT